MKREISLGHSGDSRTLYGTAVDYAMRHILRLMLTGISLTFVIGICGCSGSQSADTSAPKTAPVSSSVVESVSNGNTVDTQQSRQPAVKVESDAERGIQGVAHTISNTPNGGQGESTTGQAALSSSTAANQTEFRVQVGHNGYVWHAALSPDGKYLCSASNVESIIWEFSTGRVVRTERLATGEARAFSADGSLCVVATRKNIDLRDTFSGEIIRSCAWPIPPWIDAVEDDQRPGLIALSADGKYVASDTGCVLRIDTGKVVCMLEDVTAGRHKVGVPIAFSPDGRYVVGAGQPERNSILHIKLWDASSGQLLKRLEVENELDMKSLAISPNGKWVMCGGIWGGGVWLWDLATGKPVPTCPVRERLGACVAFSPDGRSALTGGEDAKGDNKDSAIVLWDIPSRQLVRTFGKDEHLDALSFTPDGKYILSCAKSSVKLWDVATGKEVREFEGFHFRTVSALAFSPDGNFLMFGGDNRNTRLLNVLTGEIVRRSVEPRGEPPSTQSYEPPDIHVRSISFSPDGNQVIIAGGGLVHSASSFLVLVDSHTGSMIRTFATLNGGVTYAAFADNGTNIISLSQSSPPIGSWEVSTGKRLVEVDPKSSVLCFSRDGKYFLANNTRKSGKEKAALQLRETASGDLVRVLDGINGPGNVAVFRPDGRQAIVACQGKTLEEPRDVFQFDLTTGEVVRVYEQQLNYVKYLVFSPDGGKLLLSSELTTKVYDCKTGKQVACLDGDVGGVSAGNRPLVATGRNGIMYLWDLLTSRLLYTVLTDMITGEYVTWTPDGYYRGSEYAARNMVHLVKGMQTFSIEQFFDRFYNPAMVQAKILGYKVDAPTLNAVLAGSPPPFVEIVSPKVSGDGKLVDEGGLALQPMGEVQVKVRTLDAGGGVKDLRLYHNGKRLGNDACVGDPVAQEKTTTQTYKVVLVSGDNLLTAAAFSNEMIESRPFELIIPYGQPEEKPDLYFLTVGVNTYGNNEYNLRLARGDAESLGKDLPEHAKTVFGTIHAKQLYDDQATKQDILAALAEIAGQAKPADVFAFYFAGHGVVLEDTKQFYLATHGVSKLSSAAEPGSLATEGITDQELKDALQKIPALKQVVFLDACHSGTADLVAQAMGASDEVVIKKLSRAAGTWVFTAADKQQYALEQTDLGHGLFTYALLKGIAGEADAGARDGYVKLSELETYVADTVQRLATKLNRDQEPKIYKGGDDFSIALASSPSTVTREKTPDTQVASANRSVPRTAIITGDIVNVRSGPSTSDTALTQVKQGTQVEILDGPKDTWYKVKIDTQTTGWIRGDYLRIQ